MIEAKDSFGNKILVFSEEEIDDMIRVRAYYKALLRNFCSGFEVEDWLLAEEEIYEYINTLNPGDKIEGERISSTD